MDHHTVKVIRAPSLKRGKNDEKLCDRIKLKKVLGLTVCSNAALDVSQNTGVLAYPAGCTVVLFNSKKLTQSFLLNSSRKAITAVTYSQCGRYIATGECGLNPTIKVWELDLQNGNTENGVAGQIVAEFSGHKYAINCVAFSPTGKYLVSVGSQHDMIVNVFDWRQNLRIASNKVSAKVVAVTFSEDGNYFVTVGNRHVKYWYLDGGRKYKEPQPIPLMGRSAILGELRNNDFCAVACGKGERADSTYAITRNGQLVEFNSRRLLDKWVACRTSSANCLSVSSKYILVGCAESIIRCFNADNLEYITTLPRTHYLGVDVSQGIQISHMMSAPPNAKYPDTIAIVFDENRSKVSCVYNDHSLYIWDLRDIRRVGKSHSFLYHSACIWGVETVPLNFTKNFNQNNSLPSESIITCSSDNTIRVWGLDDCDTTEAFRKNIYSKELMKIVYIDDELSFIKDVENPLVTEKSSTYDGRNGVRSIRISPDRTHLASGDRSGNIRIYDLKSSRMITSIEAHDSEVLCLEYTNEKIERRLLASASRDRLIHVFDVLDDYSILQTLDDHSSSITSVRFIGFGSQFQMVSCGADKSIIFRNFQNNQFTRGNNCSGKNTLYDMEIDSTSKHILTACQDRNIRVYSTHNAKHTKTFKGSHSDDGSLIKLSLDLSGIYIATSCTDKTLSVYDYYSNECMARMYGHSELVTGLKFTNDCKHLISASGDGCVFLWQVPHDMIVTMQARLSQQAIRYGQQVPRPLSQSINDIIIPTEQNSILSNEKFGSPPSNFLEELPVSPGYKFSDVGQLPQWAKRKTSTDESVTMNNSPLILGTSPSQTQLKEKPRGRWAQRTIDPDTLDLRNLMVDPPPNLNNHNNNSSDYNSSSSRDVTYNNTYLSEDSSIDSGMENRRDIFLSTKVYNKNIMEQKNLNSLNSESNTEHDGDVEDISDGERTGSDHGLIFYPPSVAPGTPTEFKVNEMNEAELRKSMRRQKLEKSGLVLAAQSAPSTGTGTSDDEDEGSTPSGDNAERSLASTLGGSSESIPQAASSSFLQAALDGPGSLSERGSAGRKSISAMHNRNDKSAVSSISKSFTNTKKEELMKVINDAKQKLENVGYRSNLRTSQSISDLSHQANMDMNFRGSNRSQRPGIQAKSLMSAHDDDSLIRRACSLSDLSMGKGFTSSNNPSAGNHKQLPGNRSSGSGLLSSNRLQNKTTRNSASSKLSVSGMGKRSVSVGMLNQASDSETELGRGGLLRPTISSQNKVNGGSTLPTRSYSNAKNSAAIINRRRGIQNAHSSINLSTVGQDDSSSEEKETPVQTPTGKPAVPPRPRSISVDKRFNNNNVPVNAKGRNGLEVSPNDLPCKDTDITNSDLTTQLCSNIINQLKHTTSSVMQLYQRLENTDDANGKNMMLKELENAMFMTQTFFNKITNRSDPNFPNQMYTSGDENHTNGEFIQLMDNCSDILNKAKKHVEK